jgi:hypothetical protein
MVSDSSCALLLSYAIIGRVLLSLFQTRWVLLFQTVDMAWPSLCRAVDSALDLGLNSGL